MSTQLDRAVQVIATFKGLYEEQIDALEGILDEANNDTSDGSIPERRWAKMRQLVLAAHAYNDALSRA